MSQCDPSRCTTQDRLLDSAARVFAEKGFRDATVAEICEAAEANVAAVNYHFRSKENLYVEAWRLAFERSIAAHPADGGVPPDAPGEQRLAGHIRAMIERISDPSSLEFDMVMKEHANPTGLLAEIIRQSLEPLRLRGRQIVRDLLGPNATDIDVELCQRSVMAQCLHAMMHKRRGQRQMIPTPLKFDTDMSAEHIIRFSLAGIGDRREEIERRQRGKNA